jgi:hypothetical protein
MHWIEPDCLPETQGTVEGFIMNRHGEIDGVLLGGARQTPLLVCKPRRATSRPLQAQQATAKPSSTTVPVSLEGCGTNLNLALAVDTAFDPRHDELRVF